MLLEDGEPKLESEFVGIQTIQVAQNVGSIPVLKPREVARLLERPTRLRCSPMRSDSVRCPR
jgi:hypothetical protein